MKARAGLLILLTLMFSLTGFSTTTTDLAQNSTAEEVHQDLSVNVVTVTDAEAIQIDVAETNFKSEAMDQSISENRFEASFKKADAAFNQEFQSEMNELFDVGWRNCNADNLTPEYRRDPGGVMSLFYA